MNSKDLVKKIKSANDFKKIRIVGEHGHGHWHSTAVIF